MEFSGPVFENIIRFFCLASEEAGNVFFLDEFGVAFTARKTSDTKTMKPGTNGRCTREREREMGMGIEVGRNRGKRVCGWGRTSGEERGRGRRVRDT